MTRQGTGYMACTVVMGHPSDWDRRLKPEAAGEQATRTLFVGEEDMTTTGRDHREYCVDVPVKLLKPPYLSGALAQPDRGMRGEVEEGGWARRYGLVRTYQAENMSML